MTSDQIERLQRFIEYAQKLKGDEKGEAQVFCDRLFQAFGHAGYQEAGATLEDRQQRKGRNVKFIDLLWKPRLILEMKSRKEDLHDHYQQAFEYWLHCVPHRTQYVVLCNFDEFWIYEFDEQMEEPMDRVRLSDLIKRHEALNFLLPVEKKPRFWNNRVAVTRSAADKLAVVFNSILRRTKNRHQSQRFILQCLVAMVSEDVGLLPSGIFLDILEECDSAAKSYDLIGNLFKQMNSEHAAQGGRYREVRYFNGGLFQEIDPVELTGGEVLLLMHAANEDWGKVQPAIFGSLFESSMGKEERHAHGAHFTSEADIQKVVLPTIVRPFRRRLEDAGTLKELMALRQAIQRFRVLDPACGSGNFLYVAYRELSRIGLDLIARVHADFGVDAARKIGFGSQLGTQQFYGIDHTPFAAELTKVTLALAKEFSLMEGQERFREFQGDLLNQALPLDNLDSNVACKDALFTTWPEADAIIGKPPFQSKNKMQQELGPAYLRKLRNAFPDIPGRADYCVYWFRKAHDTLKIGQRAGLVGTNTIRQNYAREGGLDYIVQHDGIITEAVSSQPWSGEASVHVSIVNWIKGNDDGAPRTLFELTGNDRQGPWRAEELPSINSSLSFTTDVSEAKRLRANVDAKACFQGQTHGHKGFLLTPERALALYNENGSNRDVIFPFLTANDMLSTFPPSPKRYVIDFHPRDLIESSKYTTVFEVIKKLVLPARQQAATKEENRNRDVLKDNPEARVNVHHANFLKQWWLLSWAREEMIEKIKKLTRYIVCGQVTKRPIFEFISPEIHPNAACMVFPFEDDYSFGILQSNTHWAWFVAKCSTLTERFRYTSDTVFDTFPWPQAPTCSDVVLVAEASRALRSVRRKYMQESGLNLRKLYRLAELPGTNPLKTAQDDLDKAVRLAYGMPANADALSFLLSLNSEMVSVESKGASVQSPGPPPSIENVAQLVSKDRMEAPQSSIHRFGTAKGKKR
jgi:SAM-dependent methyltransferase